MPDLKELNSKKAVNIVDFISLKKEDAIAFLNAVSGDNDQAMALTNRIAPEIYKIPENRDLLQAVITADQDIYKQQEAFKKLGIDSETTDAYRLAFYKDKSRVIILTGEESDDGTLSFSKAVAINNEEFNKILRRETSIVQAVANNPLQQLEKPILINSKSSAIDSEEGFTVDKIEFSEEDQKKLMAKMALAVSSAVQPDSGSNKSLPLNKPFIPDYRPR